MVSVNRGVARAGIKLDQPCSPSGCWENILSLASSPAELLKGDSANASAGLSFCRDTWQLLQHVTSRLYSGRLCSRSSPAAWKLQLHCQRKIRLAWKFS